MKLGISFRTKPRTDLEARAKACVLLIASGRSFLENNISSVITKGDSPLRDEALEAITAVSAMFEMAQIILLSEKAMADLAVLQGNLLLAGKCDMSSDEI
jgi:hypothetical protein